MNTVIGFAVEFYTLWNTWDETVYWTDANGKHWPSHKKFHFQYLKNISTSIDKVKELYPNTPITEDLRGKTRSFEYEKREEDLTPNLFKFGRHAGKTIEEVVKMDFKYLVWVTENVGGAISSLIRKLPEYIAYKEKCELERQKQIDSHPAVVNGENQITFTSNPNERQLGYADPLEEPELVPYTDKFCAFATIGPGSHIVVIFDQVKYVNGLYPYNMGIINGEAKRIKNKTMMLNLKVLRTERSVHQCKQYVTIE